MKWISQFIFALLLLTHAILIGCPITHPSDSINKAEQLFIENLISDALPIYEALYNSDHTLSQNVQSHLTLRLASCHLSLNNPKVSLKILNSLKPHPEQKSHHLYLLCIANRKLGLVDSAYTLISDCYSGYLTTVHSSDILFEKGLCLMLLGKMQDAIHDFENVSFDQKNPLVYYLSQFALVNIFQNNKQFSESHRILNNLNNFLSFPHPLFNKIAYFKAFLYLEEDKVIDSIIYFKQIISNMAFSKAAWPIDLQKKVIQGYLKAIAKDPSPNDDANLFPEIYSILQTLLKNDPKNITNYFLFYDCCIVHAKLKNEEQIYENAKNIHLEMPPDLLSEFSLEIRLKQIELIPSHIARMLAYKELLENDSLSQMKRGYVWLSLGKYLLEKNDLSTADHQSPLNARTEITEAELAFSNAYLQFILANQPDLATMALRHQLYACLSEKTPEGYERGWKIGCFMLDQPNLLTNFKDPLEIPVLTSWIALKTSQPIHVKQAKIYLEKIDDYTSRKWMPCYKKIDIHIHMYLKEWEIAQKKLNIYASQIDNENDFNETWFWRGYCAEQLKNDSLKKECYQKCWVEKEKEFSPFAYFRTYSLAEYFQKDQKAFNHLRKMPVLFPNHPLTILAYYLIGLYNKTDHFKTNGQLINSKNLTAAVEAFESAVNTYNELNKKNLILQNELPHYVKLQYLAQLEKGKINFNAANPSNNLKNEIYLEYSQEVFACLIEAINNQKIELMEKDRISEILSEAQFYLANTFIRQGKDSEALQIYNQLTINNESKKTTYWIIKGWYEKGLLCLKNLDPENALKHFSKAQGLAEKYPVINKEELLEILIEKSQSYKMLKRYDEGMRLLSDVINADIISSLRIKAMFLRAEIYELQGRHELALKQLKAISTKGGEWAKKAQIQLEKTYRD